MSAHIEAIMNIPTIYKLKGLITIKINAVVPRSCIINSFNYFSVNITILLFKHRENEGICPLQKSEYSKQVSKKKGAPKHSFCNQCNYLYLSVIYKNLIQ